jgi:hypothetical protein
MYRRRLYPDFVGRHNAGLECHTTGHERSFALLAEAKNTEEEGGHGH